MKNEKPWTIAHKDEAALASGSVILPLLAMGCNGIAAQILTDLTAAATTSETGLTPQTRVDPDA